MPYGLIALLAVLVSCSWFAYATDASYRFKLGVSILCLSSLAIGFLLPQWALGAMLIQVLLVIGFALYAKAHAPI
jgi:hypothetical protein